MMEEPQYVGASMEAWRETSVRGAAQRNERGPFPDFLGGLDDELAMCQWRQLRWGRSIEVQK